MSALKINDDVMRVLDAAEVTGSKLVLTGALDRKLYTDTNKVLEAIGGKWNRGQKAHVFDGDAKSVLDAIMETGSYSRVKQDFGQFDTPEPLVDVILRRAQIKAGMTVLEPSAGMGNIAMAASAIGGVVVDFYEIDPKRYDYLSSCANDWLRPCGLTDFLLIPEDPCYDRVVMNPPFAGQADIDHVLHAAKFLRPGGRLVSIMSGSVAFRSNAKTAAFREFVEAHGGTIEPLPEGSFKPSGTSVNTVLVTLEGSSA